MKVNETVSAPAIPAQKIANRLTFNELLENNSRKTNLQSIEFQEENGSAGIAVSVPAAPGINLKHG